MAHCLLQRPLVYVQVGAENNSFDSYVLRAGGILKAGWRRSLRGSMQAKAEVLQGTWSRSALERGAVEDISIFGAGGLGVIEESIDPEMTSH